MEEEAEAKALQEREEAEREEKEKRNQLGEALFWASLRGDLPEVRRLLALGADARYDLEEGESKGCFPLLAVSVNDYADVIEALVAGGADPNQVDGKFSCSSALAADQGQWRHQPGHEGRVLSLDGCVGHGFRGGS